MRTVTKATVVLGLLLDLVLCAWILTSCRIRSFPMEEGQVRSVDIHPSSARTRCVAGGSKGGKRSTVGTGLSLTVSGIPAPGSILSLPNHKFAGKCPYMKVHLRDWELPSLPNVTDSQRRVYLKAPWGAPIIWNSTQANAAARLQEGQFNVGLVITVLGPSYAIFLQGMITSVDKYFMTSQNVTYFLFTDDPSLATKIKTVRRIVAIEVKDKGWPCNTLLRFGSISTHRNQFTGMHFLYSLDVDVHLENKVGAEILEYLVATLHVLYYLGPRTSFTYDTNPLSTAYINKSEGEYYFIGAFFGGCRDAVIQMAETIERNIRKDLKEQRYIARWHDESHLNRYLIDNPPTKILSPEYLSTSSQKFPKSRIVSIERGYIKLLERLVLAGDWQKCS